VHHHRRVSGAWGQGDQMSLCKSRPKCIPTSFLSK
jgi:hypothetical protein